MATDLYTLADLRTVVYDRLENNQLLFPVAEVTAIINEALKVINLFTGFYQGAVTLISVAGQLVYAMPDGVVFPLRAQFNGIQLDAVAINQIGKDYRDWATSTSDKDGPVARWIPIGTNYFAINPVDSQGGQDLYVTAVLEPPLLAAADDTMVLDDEYVTLIAEYGALRMPLAEGGKIFADASALYKNFMNTMKSLTQFRQITMPRYFILAGAPVAEGNDR